MEGQDEAEERAGRDSLNEGVRAGRARSIGHPDDGAFVLCLRVRMLSDIRTTMKTNPRTTQALRARFQAHVARLWPLAKGCVAEVHKPCVRPDCPACAQGRKHRAFIFTYREGGKTHCRHVPADLVPDLQTALRNGRALEAALVQAGAAFLAQSRQARRPKGSHGAR